ncbi:MAG: MerC family mercury resistance protein [Gammaproteobacteria bacterium]|nr:MerC family mercury resistance protein [Gammaproteobacteria bacterium]MDE0368419.1 MerC family mercury resistance protein [Gammaproteobacteria bacterium]
MNRSGYSDPSYPATVGRPRLDLYAAGLSGLCLLHCLALPLLVTIMPLVAQTAESELVHRLLVVATVPVSLRVIWKTRAMHRNRLFVAVVFVGLGLLLLAAFIEAVSAHEEPITLVGGVLLCSAHLWHWARQRGTGGIAGLPATSREH